MGTNHGSHHKLPAPIVPQILPLTFLTQTLEGHVGPHALELRPASSLYSDSSAEMRRLSRPDFSRSLPQTPLEFSMSTQIKRLLLGSMAASGVVAVTAIVDLVLGIPYSGAMVFDVLFLISAAVIIYMGYEVFKEST